MEIGQIEGLNKKIIDNIEKVIIGKSSVVQLAVIGLLSQGHCLIEDVPGVGKTMLARSLAKSVDLVFKRIQFTPDMLPSDITGITFYNQKDQVFEYKPGPVVTQILLADEINRATPKTQSALLEAMEEKQITIDGVTHTLPQPFMVLATQNSIEYEGTYPLPEAQIDRFMLKIRLGYPAGKEEMDILEMQKIEHPIEKLNAVVSAEELLNIQKIIRQVELSDQVRKYIVDIVTTTRNHDDIYLGVSPRGSLGLFRTAQARASILGRDYVTPDDVKAMIIPVLAHRIIINPSGRIKKITAEQLLMEILAAIPVPV